MDRLMEKFWCHPRGLLTYLNVLLVLVGPALYGCGPIQASSAVGDAKEAIERATVSRANEFARFPFHMAQNYLDKAKELEGYSEYAAAERFARRAEELANQSVLESKKWQWHKSRLEKELRARARMGVK
jgi:hypothetical protein